MLEQLSDRIENLIDGRAAFGFNVKFDLGETGIIHVAGETLPMTVTHGDGDAHTTFRMSADDLTALLDGRLNAMNAYMSGKLVVDGDLTRAMTLSTLFS